MKIGDLVKMDFEDVTSWPYGDVWGPGIIINIEHNNFGGEYDVEIMWASQDIGWEMAAMLDVIDESA